MRKPPAFWTRPDGASHPAARILSPLAKAYAAADRRKRARVTPWRAPGPIICVGNATLGGVGKTPFAILLAGIARAAGREPAFLTRGYGGSEEGPVRVTPDHEAAAVGDEALLLSRHGEVMVARDRVAGAQALFSDFPPDLVIMDDGFQNPALSKDLSFLLVDGTTGFGNGQIFPAGPLREQPDAALARADAVVVVTDSADSAMSTRLGGFAGDRPLFRAWLEPVAPAPKPVVAFCGIGRPRKFYATAEAAGYRLRATRDFADHHSWRARDLEELEGLAAQQGVPLLTTEKDHVRLPRPFRDRVEVLPVRMVVDDPAGLREVLSPVLGARADKTD